MSTDFSIKPVGAPVATPIAQPAFLDRAAGSIVYQAINERTGAVINQFPDNAMLRRRAYFRALDLTKTSAPRGVATDRNA
jgi:hypothetical protein